MKIRFVMLSLLLTVGATAEEKTLQERIDPLFASWNRVDSPGYAVAVVKDGELVHARGYGMADLERRVAITPRTVFDIASTSKQFTGLCVLLLAREGRLSLDDDIRRHLPEMPAYETVITLRHLAHHTSGVRDFLPLIFLAGLSDLVDHEEMKVLELLARQRHLNHAPGEEFLYSNSGYFLLALIVERVSGQTLRQFAAEHIFEPLGMKHTVFLDDPNELVPDRALGYSERPEGGYRLDMSPFAVMGDGGVWTTLEDLVLWDRNFYDNRLPGGAELIEEMTRPGELANGESVGYGFGLFRRTFNGHPTIQHGGGWTGYRSQILRIPHERLTVIMFANEGTAPLVARTVAQAVLGEEVALPTADPARPAAAAGAPHPRWVGPYRSAAGELRRVELQDDHLVFFWPGGSARLRPLGAARFLTLGTKAREIAFLQDDPAAPVELTVSFQGRVNGRFQRIEAWRPSVEDMAAYTGRYGSNELGEVHHLRPDDGRLAIWIRRQKAMALEPIEPDHFSAAAVIETAEPLREILIEFERGDDGRIRGYRIGMAGIRSLDLSRLSTPPSVPGPR